MFETNTCGFTTLQYFLSIYFWNYKWNIHIETYHKRSGRCVCLLRAAVWNKLLIYLHLMGSLGSKNSTSLAIARINSARKEIKQNLHKVFHLLLSALLETRRVGVLIDFWFIECLWLKCCDWKIQLNLINSWPLVSVKWHRKLVWWTFCSHLERRSILGSSCLIGWAFHVLILAYKADVNRIFFSLLRTKIPKAARMGFSMLKTFVWCGALRKGIEIENDKFLMPSPARQHSKFTCLCPALSRTNLNNSTKLIVPLYVTGI